MINVRYSWHHFWLWWSKFLYCMYISIWPLYVSWPHGSSAFPGLLLEWWLLVCVYTAGVGGFAADGMAAKVWTCTLLSCSFTYIRWAPFVSYVYMPPRSTAMVVFGYIMWHIMPWICAYITLCLYDIWIYIYNLSNITCHYHKFGVRHRSRLHIKHLCPASSAASRDSHGMPIVHPQLPAWPIGQPPAVRP